MKLKVQSSTFKKSSHTQPQNITGGYGFGGWSLELLLNIELGALNFAHA